MKKNEITLEEIQEITQKTPEPARREKKDKLLAKIVNESISFADAKALTEFILLCEDEIKGFSDSEVLKTKISAERLRFIKNKSWIGLDEVAYVSVFDEDKLPFLYNKIVKPKGVATKVTGHYAGRK